MAKQSSANDAVPIHFGTACEQGGRPNIEDRVDARYLTTAGGLALTVAVVADGVGGSNFGERAAELTLQVVFEEIEKSKLADPAELPGLLGRTLEIANERVYQEGRAEKEKRGMGSTAVLAAIHDNKLYLANVGDSRAYLVRGAKGEQVIQLTRDHTWAWEMVSLGRLNAAEAAEHPKAEELVRSIGYMPEVSVDLGLYKNGVEKEEEARQGQGLALQVNDRVVLCSDGLIKARYKDGQPYVTEAEIAQMVTRQPPEKAAPALAQLAVNRRADDNVSAAVLEMPGSKKAFYLPPMVMYGAIGGVVLLFIIGLLIFMNGRQSDPLPTPAVAAVVPGAEPTGLDQAEETPLRSTQVPGQVLRTLTGPGVYPLPDGVQVYLSDGTEVEIEALAGQNGEVANKLLLKQGSLVVKTNGERVIVSNRVEQGEISDGVMGVTYTTQPFHFEVVCITGNCTITSKNTGGQVQLMLGERSFVMGNDKLSDPGTVDYSTYAFADVVPTPTATLIPTETPTPTETPSPTPTRRPTDTPTPTWTPVPTNTPTLEPTAPPNEPGQPSNRG